MKFVSLSLGNLCRQRDKGALSKQDSWSLVPSTHQCRRRRVKTNFIIAITSFTATRPSSYRSLMLERWISVEHLQPLLAHRRRRLPSTYDFILRFSPGHVFDHLPSLVFCHSYESLSLSIESPRIQCSTKIHKWIWKDTIFLESLLNLSTFCFSCGKHRTYSSSLYYQ